MVIHAILEAYPAETLSEWDKRIINYYFKFGKILNEHRNGDSPYRATRWTTNHGVPFKAPIHIMTRCLFRVSGIKYLVSGIRYAPIHIMTRRLFPLAALGLLITLLHSCHKPEAIPRQSTYTFRNETGRSVTFDLYHTGEDYNNERNRLQQYLIPAGGDQKIVLNVGESYWIDWYDAGYGYHNWQSGFNNASPEAELRSVAAIDDTRVISTLTHDTIRSVILNGQTSGIWRGTLASGGAGDGSYQFIFRKDLSGEYTYTSPAGSVVTEPFLYSPNGYGTQNGKMQRFTLAIRDIAYTSLFSAACNMWNYSPHTGRDSMIVQPFDNSNQFYIVRQ
jgi:hypothetical protein